MHGIGRLAIHIQDILTFGDSDAYTVPGCEKTSSLYVCMCIATNRFEWNE